MMTITTGNDNNGNERPRFQPPTWRDIVGGLMLGGLIIYVALLMAGVI